MQALRRKTMTMRDWVAKLDDFLNMSDSEVLQNAGSISNEMALEKAKTEYDIYLKHTSDELSQVEKDFLDSVKKTQKMLESKKQ